MNIETTIGIGVGVLLAPFLRKGIKKLAAAIESGLGLRKRAESQAIQKR